MILTYILNRLVSNPSCCITAPPLPRINNDSDRLQKKHNSARFNFEVNHFAMNDHDFPINFKKCHFLKKKNIFSERKSMNLHPSLKRFLSQNL